MQAMRKRRSLLVVLSLLLILVQIGCVGVFQAGFEGKQLPARSYGDLTPLQQRPAIDYGVQSFSPWNNPNSEAPRLADHLAGQEIERILYESNTFSNVQAGSGTQKTHFDFIIRIETNRGAAYAMAYLSLLTLTVLPSRIRERFIMSVEVKEYGKLVKTYHYQDYMDTWRQLFLIFVFPFRPTNKVRQQVFENLMLNFLYDLQKDGLLSGEPVGAR